MDFISSESREDMYIVSCPSLAEEFNTEDNMHANKPLSLDYKFMDKIRQRKYSGFKSKKTLSKKSLIFEEKVCGGVGSHEKKIEVDRIEIVKMAMRDTSDVTPNCSTAPIPYPSAPLFRKPPNPLLISSTPSEYTPIPCTDSELEDVQELSLQSSPTNGSNPVCVKSNSMKSKISFRVSLGAESSKSGHLSNSKKGGGGHAIDSQEHTNRIDTIVDIGEKIMEHREYREFYEKGQKTRTTRLSTTLIPSSRHQSQNILNK